MVCWVRMQGVYVDGVVFTEDLKKRAQHRLRVLREDKRQARKQHDAERKSYGQCESSGSLATSFLFFTSMQSAQRIKMQQTIWQHPEKK